MSPTTERPTLLTIPLELRQLIYSHLLPPIPTSHPIPGVGLTSVSHHPPPASMLNIHPQIASEILDYFYTITTWKLIFSHAFNFFRVDPNLDGLERSTVLARLKKVELVFYCDVLLLNQYHTSGPENEPPGAMEAFCHEIRRRADRACDVLLQAKELRTVVVSWIDTTGFSVPSSASSTDEQRIFSRRYRDILAPLRKLLRRDGAPISFQTGHVNGSAREWFVQAIQQTLFKAGTDAKMISSSERDTQHDGRVEAAKLRMLAFDVRQDRHLLHREQEEALYWGRGFLDRRREDPRSK